MKSKLTLLVFFFSLVLTNMMIRYYDNYKRLDYIKPTHEQKQSFNVDKSSKITQNKINELSAQLAQHGVVLTKSVYYDDYQVVFISQDKGQYFNYLQRLKFNFSNTPKMDGINLPFISTYQSNDESQVAIVPDFMANDRIRFYRMEDIVESGGYVYGTYYLNYDQGNIRQFEEIINSTLKISIELNEVEMMIDVESSSKYLQYSFVLSGIILVFMITTTLFSMFNKTQKISVYLLQGFRFIDVLFDFVKDMLLAMFLSLSISIIFLKMFIPQVSFIYFGIHTLVFIFIMFIYVSISALVLYFVFNGKNEVSYLKNHRNTDTLLLINMALKLFLSIILILFVMNISDSILALWNQINTNKAFYEYRNVVVHYGITTNEHSGVDISTIEDYINQYYKSLKSSNLEYIVSEFFSFNYPKEEDIAKMTDEWNIKMSKDFLDKLNRKEVYVFGVIDKNYLNKNHIQIYDRFGEIVDLGVPLNKIKVLIPQSEINSIEKLEKYLFTTDISENVLKIDLQEPLDYYWYEDRSFSPYTPDINDNEPIVNPNLFIVDYSSSLPAYKYAGIGESDIKFFLNQEFNKKMLYQELSPYLDKAGLSEHLRLENFLTYGEMYGQGNYMAYSGLITMIILMSSILIIYIMVILQQIKLYQEHFTKVFAVQKLLGYRLVDIYGNMSLHFLAILASSILSSFSIYYYRAGKIGMQHVIGLAILISIEIIVIFSKFYNIEIKKQVNILKEN